MAEQQQPQHAPYAPKTASIGGVPTKSVDIPIVSVFLVLFIGGAIGHMTLLQLNRRRNHKFLLSGAVFGFCMARIVTQIMRIVWACYPTDVSVAIAAQIFVSAGIIVLFIVNIIFAQRILRATHPHIGWHKGISMAFNVMISLVLVLLVMLITATVQSFYTLNPNTRRIDLDLQHAGSTYFMAMAFLPIPIIILSMVLPRRTPLEKFGVGHWRIKIAVLLTSATILTLGAAFRTGTSFMSPRARTNPAWYDAKWCFYFFNFTLEIIVVYMYLIFRVDQRFHVPDGSKGPGDYSATKVEANADHDLEQNVSSDTEETSAATQVSEGEKLHFVKAESAHMTPPRSATSWDGETVADKELEARSQNWTDTFRKSARQDGGESTTRL